MAITDEKIKDLEPKVDDDIIDIDLSATARRKFRINGDNSRIVELNPSDLSIISRIRETDKRFNDCIKELEELALADTTTDEAILDAADKFDQIDDKMRQAVDYIFQSNVSEVCVPKGQGSMYDPFNGKYRFEHIIEALLTFYEGNIQSEYKKMSKVVQAKAAKYTKKKK